MVKLIDPSSELINIRKKMGAPLNKMDDIPLWMADTDAIEQLAADGIEVSYDEINILDPFLGYKDQLTVLYINTPSRTSKEELLDESIHAKKPKFHITWCKTLDQMHKRGRGDRYVLSTKKISKYKIQATDLDTGEKEWIDNVKLDICRYCLDRTNYNGFTILKTSKEKKDEIVQGFVLADYFEENQASFTYLQALNHMSEEDSGINDYPLNWRDISVRLRDSKNWTCEKCKVNLKDYKRGLQVHHRNGMRNDNKPQNLQVLCAICHKNIDEFHSGMCIRKEDERNILRKSREQGIDL